MKLYIIIYGLVALVPTVENGTTSGLTALVLSTKDADTLSGMPLPLHEAKIQYHGFESPPVWNGLSMTNLSISPSSGQVGEGIRSVASGTPDDLVASDSGLVELTDIYANLPGVQGGLDDPPRVRATCLSDLGCNDRRNQNLVLAKIEIEGDWLATPIEISRSNPSTVVASKNGGFLADDSTYGFLTLNEGTPRFAEPTGQYARGLLLEIDLSSTDMTVLADGSEVSGSKKDDAPDCAPLGLPSGPCSAIIISNSMPHEGRMDCNSPPTDRIDYHFDRFYDLLVDLPRWRLLPYLIDLDETSCSAIYPGGSGGNPPRVKCMTPMLER